VSKGESKNGYWGDFSVISGEVGKWGSGVVGRKKLRDDD
jgi:hypothetical protein